MTQIVSNESTACKRFQPDARYSELHARLLNQNHQQYMSHEVSIFKSKKLKKKLKHLQLKKQGKTKTV